MEWISVKDETPPLGEVIEGIVPIKWRYSQLGRDYFALVKIKKELIWITPLLNDVNYTELQITHWRYILPDLKGRKPFVRIKKTKFSWEPKVIFKKSNI